jgi:glyoxylase-like metal-dependent hydrolase (beta-lactamase superfamily II)
MTGVQSIAQVVLPIGVNAVESVNCYVLPDGDRVAVVDCGVWRPDLPDGGLATLEAGLRGAGYELTDVGRIVVTHAHIDHYGLAGRLMELTGAELVMHAMTDLDCEKYRHPDTARARRRDTYSDHGVSEEERGDLADHLTRWLPYRRLEKIRRAIREQPRSIVELADLLVAKAVLAHQRQLAINETLAHVACLRWSGVVERRTRSDGVYEWYATADTAMDVSALAAP